MKTMRKLFTVLLALAMTLALAVSAFAADTGSITITNPQGDHTYTAYKIFDVTYTADGGTTPTPSAIPTPPFLPSRHTPMWPPTAST